MNAEQRQRPAFVIFLMALGFIAILGFSLAQRIMHPSLTVQRMPQTSTPVASNMPPDEMASIGLLMKKAAQNPNNLEVLLELIENLMSMGQWQAAENFTQKALALDPENHNPKFLYLLALAHHNKGEHAQAAEILEKLLAKNENPSARYSLAILNLHYLNKPEAGIEELKKGLAIPNLSPALGKALQEELEKAQNNSVASAKKMPENPADAANPPAQE